jgi:flagellar hook-associated protein 2
MFQMGGIASGLDTNGMIDALMAVEKQPLNNLVKKQNQLLLKQVAYNDVKTHVQDFYYKVTDYTLQGTFLDYKANVSDTGVISQATPTPITPTGTYYFKVLQKAERTTIGINDIYSTSGADTKAKLDKKWIGNFVDLNKAITDTSNPPLASSVTEGTVTINGTDVATINSTTTITDVINNINSKSSTTGVKAVYLKRDLNTGTYTTVGDTSNSDLINQLENDKVNDKLVLFSADGWNNMELSGTSDFLSKTYLSNAVKKLGPNGISYMVSGTHLGAAGTTKTLQQLSYMDDTNYGSSAPAIASGNITINGKNIDIDVTKDTIADLVQKINDADVGMKASYDYQNDKIVFTGDDEGPVTLTVHDNGTHIADYLQFITDASDSVDGSESDIHFDTTQNEYKDVYGDYHLGQNTVVNVYGDSAGTNVVSQLESSNDTVSYKGMTLNVNQSSSDVVSVTVSQDTDSVVKKIKDLIDSYNDLMDYLYGKYTEDPIKDLPSDATDEQKEQGILKNDDIIETLMDKLRNMMTTSLNINGTYDNLMDIGVDTYGYDDVDKMMKGSLKVNDSKLTQAVESHLNDVMNLFNNQSDDEDSQGIAVKMKGFLWSYTKFGGLIDQRSGISGTIANQLLDISKQISSWKVIIQNKEYYYRQKFTAMEEAVSKLQSQMSYMSAKLGTSK